MVLNEKEIKSLAGKMLPVYYLYSADSAQLDHTVRALLTHLGKDETDFTRIEGPVPGIDELIAAAGTISFFCTRRIVFLPLMKPSAYSEKDMKDLFDTLESVESATVVITSLVNEEWGKVKLSKAEQKLATFCEKIGFSALLERPSEKQLAQMLTDRAKQQNTSIDAKAVSLLMERCGQDRFLLENEIDKLAASSGYTNISVEGVKTLGTRSLEADTFDLVKLVNSGRTVQALKELDILLRLQNEPIAIAAALASSYQDLYRVACANENKCTIDQAFKDFGYKGSTYRLRKANDTARRYRKRHLLQCLKILEQLDKTLKSAGTNNGSLALQTALCEMAATGGNR